RVFLKFCHIRQYFNLLQFMSFLFSINSETSAGTHESLPRKFICRMRYENSIAKLYVHFKFPENISVHYFLGAPVAHSRIAYRFFIVYIIYSTFYLLAISGLGAA